MPAAEVKAFHEEAVHHAYWWGLGAGVCGDPFQYKGGLLWLGGLHTMTISSLRFPFHGAVVHCGLELAEKSAQGVLCVAADIEDRNRNVVHVPRQEDCRRLTNRVL